MSSGLDTLRGSGAVEIIEPGSAEYETAGRTIFASGSPARIVRPTRRQEVQAAVSAAVADGLPISVRGGGHSFAGFGTRDAGVVIDLGKLRQVQVIDERRNLVRIGGGATWGQATAALAPHGLAISAGDTKSVGVGGLTLTGGIGWKVRNYGLALDNVVGAELVTADGGVVYASADENPDLFWAIRGGGGNFGIVTAFDFAAHESSQVVYGRIAFPAAETATVLPGWADYLRSAPDELTAVVNLANPASGASEAQVEIYVAVDTDDTRFARSLLDPIRRLGTVLDDSVALTDYADTLAVGALPPDGLRFVIRSAFVLRESVAETLRLLGDVSTAPSSPFINVRSLGGAVSRVADDATAYAHRRAELMVMTLTAGPALVVDAALPAVDAIWHTLAPHVTGAYANFLSSATDADVAAIYPAATARRLAAVKSRYDPNNVFAGNHNIRPDGAHKDLERRADS